MLLKWDNISWPRTLVISDNSIQWLVANTLFPEMNESSQPRGWIQGNTTDLYQKLRADACTVNMELKSESGLRVKTILILGSECFMEQISMWLIQTTTAQKFLQIYLKTSVTIECEGYCSQIKGKSKTTKKRNCWITEHYSNEWKKVDWYWSSGTLFLCVRGLEESNQSSST